MKRFVSGGLITIFIISVCLVLLGISRPKPNLDVVVAPDSATLIMDGKTHIKDGEQHVKPGRHTVVASLAGFSSVTENVNVTSKSVAKLTFLLSPNSAAGYTYLQDNQAEQLQREALGGQQFNSTVQQAVSSTGFIKELPYIGPGLEFRIDYGGGANSSGKPIIYITGETAQAQQDALTWIKYQGYNPSTMDIQYVTGSF